MLVLCERVQQQAGGSAATVYRTGSSIAAQKCICAKRFLCRYSGYSAIQGAAIGYRRLYVAVRRALFEFDTVKLTVPWARRIANLKVKY